MKEVVKKCIEEDKRIPEKYVEESKESIRVSARREERKYKKVKKNRV